jgi:hypothetical protein
MQVQAIGTGTGLNQAMSLTSSGAASKTRSASAGGTGSATSSTANYDVMDTNKDGFVSFVEWLIYTLTHSAGTASETQAAQGTSGGSESLAGAVSAYNRQGNAGSSTSQAQSLVDLFA